MAETELQRSESFTAAALLALAGGLLDAYTYLCRGQVFANAETGNIVLLALRLAEGRWGDALHYLLPILAFALGVLAAEFIKGRHRAAGTFHWRHTVLLAEIAVLVIAACVPMGGLDSVVNAMVAFVCAMQVQAFRKVRGNAFASTMCTGNLRSGTDTLYHGMAGENRALLGKSACYFGVIGFFILGAALGGMLAPRFGQWAVLGAVGFQLAAFLWMCGGRRG